MADKFIAALSKVGVNIENVTPENSDLPFLFYKIEPLKPTAFKGDFNLRIQLHHKEGESCPMLTIDSEDFHYSRICNMYTTGDAEGIQMVEGANEKAALGLCHLIAGGIKLYKDVRRA